MTKNKKAQVPDIAGLVIPLVVIAVVLAVGFLIMSEISAETLDAEQGQYDTAWQCNTTNGSGCGYAFNATSQTRQALDDIPGWLPIIVITVIGAMLIGLVGLFRRR